MSDSVQISRSTDVNMNALASNAQLLAFDLDNTLARSKMPMSDDTARLFSALTHIMPVAIVTGGRYELIESQVLDVITQHAYLDNLSLLPTTGSSYFAWDGYKFSRVYSVELSDEQKTRIRTVIERNARELGLWYDHVAGVHIEDRGSQMTFSALGAHAAADEKEAWDPDGSKRTPLVERLQEQLPDVNVRIAGTTSIDISQRGLDKAYAVKQLAQLHNIDVKNIVFMGDRMTPDGNDYPVAVAGAQTVSVQGPEDTNGWMRRFMETYTRGMRVDVVDRRLWIHGDEVSISDSEFSLLLALMHSNSVAISEAKNSGAYAHSISRDHLIHDAWKYAPTQDTRLLSVSIARLRAIIEDNPQMPRRIVTVRGEGYRFSYK